MRVLKPGDRIADRYEIDTVLARGGMGAVYRATDTRTGRAVAVKVVLKELAGDRTALARFEREAMAAARLAHPGVVSVLDFGTTPEGLSYLVMEHVAGRTLAEVLDQEGRLAPARAADIVEQALGGLEAAHAAGIVHRDLKPGNLMLVPAGAGGREIVKLLDFGVAQLKTGEAYTRLTQTGAVVGTPAFMSPEQARGEECDPRTDVYAMGMVLWCSLTGQRAFKGNDLAELLVAVQTEVPPRADLVVPEIPAELASIAARALEKRMEDRWSSAAELAAALVAVRSSLSAPPSVRPPPAQDALPTLRDQPRPVVPEPLPFAGVAASAPSSVPAPVASLAPLAGAATQPWWPRALALLIVLALGGTAVAIGLIALGLFELGPRTLTLPRLPFPAPAPPTVSAPPVPPGEITPQPMMPVGAPPSVQAPCVHAYDCCFAFQERVHPLGADCAELVGASPDDDAHCQAQLDGWLAESIEDGAPLAECITR